jgi:hypothetical protein
MSGRIATFASFWYDFIVGDDWRVAVGVVAALALTYGLSIASVPSWWVMPAAVLLLLPMSLWRVARRHRSGPSSASNRAD